MAATGESQAWHGVPCDEIDCHPTVDASLCMGCDLCVTGCGKQVYGYDYSGKKPVVLRST